MPVASLKPIKMSCRIQHIGLLLFIVQSLGPERAFCFAKEYICYSYLPIISEIQSYNQQRNWCGQHALSQRWTMEGTLYFPFPWFISLQYEIPFLWLCVLDTISYILYKCTKCFCQTHCWFIEGFQTKNSVLDSSSMDLLRVKLDQLFS